MADNLTPAERSVRMSRIRSRDTAPEVRLRRALHALGMRFRLHAKLPGKPDIVMARYKAVIMVHGCFWHRHEGCKVATTPKSNTAFWIDKFSRNVTRDQMVAGALSDLDWRVIVAWECELSTDAKAREVAGRIRDALVSGVS